MGYVLVKPIYFGLASEILNVFPEAFYLLFLSIS